MSINSACSVVPIQAIIPIMYRTKKNKDHIALVWKHCFVIAMSPLYLYKRFRVVNLRHAIVLFSNYIV